MVRAPLRSFFDCCRAILFLMFVCGVGGGVFFWWWRVGVWGVCANFVGRSALT